MFALVVPDCYFNLPKNLLIAFAHRRSESRNGGRSVEVKDAQKVFVFKPFVRLHVAPAHQRIGDADRRGISELNPDVINIVLFQVRIRNVVENVPLMLIPKVIGELGGDGFKLIPQSVFAGDAIAAFQHIPDCLFMFLSKLPQPDSPGVFPCPGVSNIEDVPEPRVFSAGVDQGDTL